MKKQIINVLGTRYILEERNIEEDPKLEEFDGYFDNTVRKIVVDDMESVKNDFDAKEDLEEHKKKVKRHEIIHAFLYESGLGPECSWACEEMIDWLAIQTPKIFKEFKIADLL